MADHSSGPPTRPSLLLRLRDPRDGEAWQTFVTTYTPFLFRYLRRRGLQDADAADVTQDVLRQVLRSIQKFDYHPAKGRFHNWLRQVTKSQLLHFLEKQGRQTRATGGLETEDRLEDVASLDQDSEWTEAFQTHILQSALERIRPEFEEKTWQAFARQWLDHRAADETAHELSLSAGAVYTAKYRVLKRLEEVIRELADDAPCWS